MNLQVSNRLEDFILDQGLVKRLETYILASLEIEDFGDDVEVSLSFVGEDEIRGLNKDFRGKDEVTDVLSFPSFDEYTRVLGDIVICVPRAKIQAEEIGNSLEEEITYLSLHSSFHLLGYDHMDEEEKKLMRAKEKLALKLGEEYEKTEKFSK